VIETSETATPLYRKILGAELAVGDRITGNVVLFAPSKAEWEGKVIGFDPHPGIASCKATARTVVIEWDDADAKESDCRAVMFDDEPLLLSPES
jgi:hypothetical protein